MFGASPSSGSLSLCQPHAIGVIPVQIEQHAVVVPMPPVRTRSRSSVSIGVQESGLSERPE